MSLFQTYPIKCSCGNVVDVEIHSSVNITVSPELLSRVQNRKINNYKCSNCGSKSELARQFLYVDLDKKLWIWCYPESTKIRLAEIEKDIFDSDANKMMESIIQQKPLLVFGYDELFQKINGRT